MVNSVATTASTASILLFLASSLYAAQSITSAQASPDGIAIRSSTLVTITAQISPDATLIQGSVTLISYNGRGMGLATLGLLHDDGTHGDQQAGDNIYTTQLLLNQPTPTQLLFRVSAAYRGKLTRVLSDLITVDVVRVPSTQEIQAITSTNHQAVDVFTSTAATQGLATARSATISFLAQQDNVQSVGFAPDGESIWVQYSNGLYGGLFTGPAGTWGGPPSSNHGVVASPVAYDNNVAFAELELESVYNKWLSSAGIVVPDPIVRGPAVSIEFMRTLSNYGAVSLAAHGILTRFGDPAIAVFGTGTIQEYIDWARGWLYINILYTNDPWFVLPAYIKHYDKSFPASIIFLSMCHSLDNTNLSQAFITSGSQAVFGWQHNVSASFAKKTKDALMIQMLDHGMTARQAYEVVPHVDTDCNVPECNPAAVLMLDGDPNAALVSLPSTTLSDDFNGTSIDTSKWNVVISPAGAGTITETNQRAEMVRTAAPGVVTYQGLQSRCKLSGDFDVQVDFTLLNWPAQNFHTVRFAAQDLPQGPLGLVGIYRNSYNAEGYQMRTINGVVKDITRSDLSGKLRLVRTGSTIFGYYWDGAQFVLLASSPTTTDDTSFVLDFASPSTTSPSGVAIAFDNFKQNSGTLVCP